MSAYQVLARTWRPQNFSDIVGQSHVTKTLENIIESKRVGHAYLFAGTRGVGKTSIARIFAKALNCKNPQGVEPCGKCDTCKEIAASSAIDVVEIDGASNNGVNSIRELREQVAYLPTSGKYKIYIIDEVHMLTGSAFNALLKTLEEPPARVVFMFATTEIHEIPATILSRCQRFNFRKVSRKEIFEHLQKVVKKEEILISEAGLNLISKEAGGSVRDSLSLLEQVVSFSGKEITDRQVLESIGLVDHGLVNRVSKAIFRNDVSEVLNVLKTLNDFGTDCRTFLSSLLEQIRNILILKLHMQTTSLNEIAFKEFIDLPEEELEELKDIATLIYGDREIHRVFSIINDSVSAILSSVLPLVTMEATLLRAACVKGGINADSILKKLQDLETRVMRNPVTERCSSSGISAGNDKMSSFRVAKPDLRKDKALNSQPTTTLEEKKPKNMLSKNISKWEELVSYVRSKKPLLAANLEEGNVLSLKDKEIKLSYESENFSYRQITDSENKRELDKIFKQHAGEEFKLNVVIGEDSDSDEKINLQRIKNEKIETNLNQMKNMAENHPNINNVKELLGGKIIDIRVRDDSNK